MKNKEKTVEKKITSISMKEEKKVQIITKIEKFRT